MQAHEKRIMLDVKLIADGAFALVQCVIKI